MLPAIVYTCYLSSVVSEIVSFNNSKTRQHLDQKDSAYSGKTSGRYH